MAVRSGHAAYAGTQGVPLEGPSSFATASEGPAVPCITAKKKKISAWVGRCHEEQSFSF